MLRAPFPPPGSVESAAKALRSHGQDSPAQPQHKDERHRQRPRDRLRQAQAQQVNRPHKRGSALEQPRFAWPHSLASAAGPHPTANSLLTAPDTSACIDGIQLTDKTPIDKLLRAGCTTDNPKSAAGGGHIEVRCGATKLLFAADGRKLHTIVPPKRP